MPATTTGGGVSTAPGGYVDWRQNPLDPMAPVGIRSRAVEPDTSKIRLGPLEKIYLIWMVGGSCDGCSVAATGATHPRVEHLLAGIIPGLPRVELIHTVVSVECGAEWTHNLFMAERGELDAPYVICWEGSTGASRRSLLVALTGNQQIAIVIPARGEGRTIGAIVTRAHPAPRRTPWLGRPPTGARPSRVAIGPLSLFTPGGAVR